MLILFAIKLLLVFIFPDTNKSDNPLIVFATTRLEFNDTSPFKNVGPLTFTIPETSNVYSGFVV